MAQPFSFSHDRVERPSVPCFITYTTAETHRIIRENMSRSPLYGGKIVGKGPRYCPSIEDKVVRFPARERHQVFVEPGRARHGRGVPQRRLLVPAGRDVQEKFLHSIPGLEKLVISRPGYAVEYDFLFPTQLFPSLMTKKLEGLFVAGQTNGTSGYEEAAAQGIIAGINAALHLQGKEPLVLSRADAYIGVLVDDLATLGTEEPYRLFTSRAEHRLSLMHDTADIRLLPKGKAVGLQDEAAAERLGGKIRGIAEARELLRRRKVTAEDVLRTPELETHKGRTFDQALRDPRVTILALAALDAGLGSAESSWLSLAEAEVKYEGYITRQEEQVGRFLRMEEKAIPRDFDWDALACVFLGGKGKAQAHQTHLRWPGFPHFGRAAA